jgi:hypothetical protein
VAVVGVNFKIKKLRGVASGSFPADNIEKFFLYSFIETVGKVTGQGAASCFSCGFGETCRVGVPMLLYGEGAKITEDMIPQVTKQNEVMESAAAAGKYLGERLRSDHDRKAVTQKMQKTLRQMFAEAA